MIPFYLKLTTVPIGNSLFVWKEGEREGSEGGREGRREEGRGKKEEEREGEVRG